MSRLFAVVCTLLALTLVLGTGTGTVDAQGKKNQMVKGTIKDVDVKSSVLVVNQKVKNEFVERELSILETTEFVVMKGTEKKEANGKLGLIMLIDAKGANVQVKCDKDVNVLKVTVNLK